MCKDLLISWIRRIKIVKIYMLPKANYSLSKIPTKNSESFFKDREEKLINIELTNFPNM